MKLPAQRAGLPVIVTSFILCPSPPTTGRGCGARSGRKLTAERVQAYNWLIEGTLKNALRGLNGMKVPHTSERKRI